MAPPAAAAAEARRTIVRPTLFIDGEWRASSDGNTRVTIDPSDASDITTLDEATPDDARRAIASARAYFDTSEWSTLPFSARCDMLERVSELLQQHKPRIAALETIDTGKTYRESEIDVDDVTSVFAYYAKEARAYDAEQRITGDGLPDTVESTLRREAVGVCVLITPWNYPLLQLAWKMAPALAAGNTVVVKPSEVTPLTSVYLVRLLLEAGVPPRAVQLLTASGAAIGPVLTESEDVDLVSFTGGIVTGRDIARRCTGTVKRCLLELGGKNPNVVFADCDLDVAIDNVLTAAFVHSGQVCSAGTRLIVEDAIADALVAGVVERAQRIQLGNGFDERAECGPLVNAAQLAKMEAYIELARREGARVLCGGARPAADTLGQDAERLQSGFFFSPTVLDGCDRTMRIVQEETFGPILTVERFADGDEAAAVRLANDTTYGLAGGVQSADVARAQRVARRLRHGTVWINTYGAYTPLAEWGGYKRSGNGRELGRQGLDEYLETKHIWRDAPQKMGWFRT